MNTMELVRLVERAQPRPISTRTPTPLFHSELIGPARQAILCARHFLLSEQRDDGSWLGQQAGDASLPSQLILWLAFLGREQSQLAQQAAATILAQQQPGGGWSLVPDGPPDVSISVQAYFALKLTALDPCDQRLGRARQVIRQLGGADAADGTTRYFLALLGQVSYDCCDAMPPELATIGARCPLSNVPLALIWSHRPMRDAGIERGVRELFLNPARDWPSRPIGVHADAGRSSLNSFIRSRLESAWRLCERRGWTPLRRRALDLAESLLIEHLDASRIGQLDFCDLLWHTIALRAIGYPADCPELCACDERMQDMICIDEENDRASPRRNTSPSAGTVVVLQSLAASGVSRDHPAIAAAMKYLSKTRRSDSSLDVLDLSNIIQSLAAARARDSETDGALPPDIEVSRGDWDTAKVVRRMNRRLDRIRHVAAALVDRLLQLQNKDGGWNKSRLCDRSGRNSAPDVTGAVLQAIATAEFENTQAASERAVTYLRATQRADGSWESALGVGPIHTTALVVRGMLAAGVSSDDDAIAAGVNWLVVRQQPSGGWGESSRIAQADTSDVDYHSSRASVSHTAWALLALVAAGQAHHPAARRAVNFLIETQDDDGRWHEPHFVVRDTRTGTWFRNDLHTVAWPLMALSCWAVAATADRAGGTDSIALRLVNTSADL